ncbi:MAG: leucine--tRNA ligase [Burkholderiaceae bacterium]|nr:leucine--tRNA ligase [Burkholderiaceae bacterium]
MDPKYEPQKVEAQAQRHWESIQAYRAVENAADGSGAPKPKFYVCSMLPYPSGKLHMGHVRNYTLNDVLYRVMRMRGYNVMTPMGWDAFGLPSENAAIDKKVSPAAWTYANIADMKSQMQPLGLAFDWSREVTTCKPDYYVWNQWMFLKMLESGIAYRKTQVVNWDPVDQTVLANEQVIDGRGWRSDAVVEKREIPGYFLAITRYADELLEDLQDLDWPPQVRTMQENWIGKSVGVNFGFPYSIDGERDLLRVFTTRADTIMGVTFVAIAAEHPLAARLARDKPEVAAFIDACKRGGVSEVDVATIEKTGVATGFFVTHPLAGQQVEVWIGNYVLMGYGEGAVMGVPGHDQRDFEFAQRYRLPIKQVIAAAPHLAPADGGCEFSADAWQPWYADKEHGACVNSGKYNALMYEEAVDAIASDLKTLGLGEKQVQWRLRDWGISRQRYWGTPIPIIHCGDCGVVPVPEKDLPVVLPEHLIPDGSGNPLNKYEPFLKCECPRCGKPARRETDTMDTFVDSSWYYMRYCSPDNTQAMVDQRTDFWMPMDQYIGGIEHAVLHLLYARFWTKVMRDMGLVKFDEPFKRLFTQGMLTAECYYREDSAGKKRWYYPGEVDIDYDDRGRPVKATAADDGEPVHFGGVEKMSKSKNNVVEPRDIIERFGADTARAFVMFAGPPDQSAPWSSSSADGTFRFLRRLWAYCHQQQAGIAQLKRDPSMLGNDLSASDQRVRREIHMNLKQAGVDYERMHYNTVVSAAMKMLNALEGSKSGNGAIPAVSPAVTREAVGILLRVLYPIAPHITHALWNELGFQVQHGEIIDTQWPQVDDAALAQDEMELVVQVNGKVRGSIRVPAHAEDAAITATALADANVLRFVEGRPVKFSKVVRPKLVTIAV